jgi:hypothetical protein
VMQQYVASEGWRASKLRGEYHYRDPGALYTLAPPDYR